jgi:superfamily I DNA/RNA helicase
MPYRVVGGLRFYERAEIRDAIAYMRALCSRPTTWRSSASSTCRAAASARSGDARHARSRARATPSR